MDTNVLDLLKRSAAIPSMPQIATRFLEIIQDPGFEQRDVVEVLSTDPGTAAEILRLANSSLFGVTRQVTALGHAITLLGIKRIRSLVLGRYIVDSINQRGCANVEPSYYWRRSLTTAVLAARLAEVLDARNREEAFISGLLADVGVAILDDAVSEQYRPVAEQYQPGGNIELTGQEQELLNTTHAEVSALVLEHWQLPETICQAVACHPWESRNDQTPLLSRIVGAAERVGKYLCERPTEMDTIIQDCRQIVSELRIEPVVLARTLEEIEQQIEELADLLSIDVIFSQVFEMIAKEIREQLVEPAASTT